ncbi:GMC oxidoreductase [Candidatus Palauibacter sp.]|uniref:GMC oxidoreductase n=1 Tax=Candidatus Palauibacter sp. TaxID=3101350 RepID=UPI003CC557E5
MTRVVESDVCIIGGGISAAMVAERLAERTTATITVVEAGERTASLQERSRTRARMLAYGENPYPNDHIPGQTGTGAMYSSMLVGGSAMHWGGATPRYSPEDFRLQSLYGVGFDWPISWDDVEPYYQEAEERIGVAGEPGPPEYDPRSKPYPMPPMPLSYNLARMREWTEKTDIPFWTQPWARNTEPYQGRNVCRRCDTCSVCPTGAKYTPDFAFDRLLADGRIDLITRTLVRRLTLEPDSDRIAVAEAVDRDAPDEPVEFRAGTFVLAGGHAWSPHLLLLSANSRFPDGLANRTGNVGRYMTGHWYVSGFINLPMRLYPGIFVYNSLLSHRFASPGPLDRYVRHDLRLWESAVGRTARLMDEDGRLLWGDEVMADWRARTESESTARIRAYYDLLPDRESRLTLNPGSTNALGDPMPRIDFRPAQESIELGRHTYDTITGRFEELARAAGGAMRSTGAPSELWEHPGGGCRMGDDPATSVVDRRGRAHDHENLFVAGAPTIVSSGCANGTLTFCALSLMAAEEMGKELPSA